MASFESLDLAVTKEALLKAAAALVLPKDPVEEEEDGYSDHTIELSDSEEEEQSKHPVDVKQPYDVYSCRIGDFVPAFDLEEDTKHNIINLPSIAEDNHPQIQSYRSKLRYQNKAPPNYAEEDDQILFQDFLSGGELFGQDVKPTTLGNLISETTTISKPNPPPPVDLTDKRARQREYERRYRAKLTPEKRAEQRRRAALNRKAKIAALTETQKGQFYASRYSKMTPEQKTRHKAYMSQYRTAYRAAGRDHSISATPRHLLPPDILDREREKARLNTAKADQRTRSRPRPKAES